MTKVALRPIDKFEDMLKDNMKLVKGSKSESQFAKQIGSTHSTLNNRMHNPLTMRLDELFAICEKNHVSIASFVSKKLELG